MSTEEKDQRYVLSMDVGTTVIKSFVYDESAKVVGSGRQSMTLSYPDRDRVEIEPDILWETFVTVAKAAIADSKVDVHSIKTMGLSTLRNSFTIWNKRSGKHYTNFITWKDNRCSKLCDEWNKSLSLKAMQKLGSLTYSLTGIRRFMLMSIFKLSPQMVVPKLLWALQQDPDIRRDAEEGDVLYGTVDTWLVWKLTSGQVHATDPSNACVSGIYDPFTLRWSLLTTKLFSIPFNILPEVRDTNAGFGTVSADILGFDLPIGAVIGDQQAAVFGECCFDVGDVKATLGTGSFIDVNTGNEIHCSFQGTYPLVGWKLRNQRQPTYLVEGCSSDTGAIIQWAKQSDLFNETSELMQDRLPDSSGGVYFVPAFSGLQAPYRDAEATTAFIGITAETTKGQMMRSILESLAFRMKQMYAIMEEEWDHRMNNLVVDGGVANNDFIVQLASDLTGKKVVRDKHREMSSRGAAFMAGLSAGIWSSTQQLKSFMDHEHVFHPRANLTPKVTDQYNTWQKAVQRCLQWY